MPANGLTAKVVLHRSTIDAVILGGLDGLFELAKAIIVDAGQHAPDSPAEPYPTGEGLPRQGGVLAYAKGAKVAGWSLRGLQPKRARAFRVDSRAGGFVIYGGFGSHIAHFAELGTIKERARPFLTPALLRDLPQAEKFLKPAVAKRLAALP